MDSLRLADLLLVLVCEGRRALPKSSAAAVPSRVRGLGDGYDRTHRHLIDSIRQRDTDALIEAIESGNVEVNFTDDVGQTLLNWASAFGTPEMVTYLCEKAADVNKGQRSSSLHYAACFGRPEIAKILLRHGANPDLRDEEGKTALDKARERSDDGHREVGAVLESPGDYMASIAGEQSNQTQSEKDADKTAEDGDEEPLPDPQLKRNLLERLLPVFCEMFQKTLVSGVRRSSLNLMRKTVHYMDTNTLASVSCDVDEDFAEKLVGVLGAVLDQEDDIDGHSTVLAVMKDLLQKDAEFWLEQLARLGLFEKVEALAQVTKDTAAVVTTTVVAEPDSPSVEIPRQTSADPANDSWSIEPDAIYRWRDWRVLKSRDSLFVWCDACALEFSDGSNGWFRFLIDGRLSTMYSSGSPETGSDNSDTRAEFLEKLQRARVSVRTGTPLYSVLSVAAPGRKIAVGNWVLECLVDSDLIITNSEGNTQKLTIGEDLPGFHFESNRQTRHVFVAESTLGPEFVTGWTARGGRRLRFKVEAQKQKLADLARELWDGYLKEARGRPREALIRLKQAAAVLKKVGDQMVKADADDVDNDELYTALQTVKASV
uniref:E3 ubiquitin-protein ligase n=1 Tax=Plectus sambesii TaxID=2011161 RepID=A0A914XRQ8_9BILA